MVLIVAPLTNSCLLAISVETKAIVITEKKRSKKVQKLKKNVCLEPAAELVDHCLSTWFWQECTTEFPVFSLPHCLQCIVKSKQKQILIHGEHNKFPDDVRLILPKSRLEACLDYQVTTISKLPKKTCFKKYFRKQLYTNRYSNSLPHAWQSVNCSTNWAIYAVWFQMEYCSASLSSTCCRAQTERCVNSWDIMGLCSWSVDVGSSRQVISMTDKERGKHKTFFYDIEKR